MMKISVIALMAMLIASTYQEKRILSSDSNNCTRDHCYYCETDGNTSWCSRCGNGKAISSKEGKNRSCSKTLTVQNCRAAPLDDPTNADLCGECKRGYFLENPTSCVKLELKGCDRPYKESADGKVLCDGCEGKFLLDDKTGCDLKPKQEFPDNCQFGGLTSKGKCETCKPNWFPSVTGMSCEEERIKGCAIYHPNDPHKCFTCNSSEFYYATKGTLEGDNVFQSCQFSAYMLGMKVAFMSVIGFLIM